MKIEKKELPKSLIEFKITVDEKELETYHSKGFAAVQKMVEIDGFRKGNAPEDVIVKKYGDMIILEEMANLALRDSYIKALEENKINPISEPTVSITKLAKGNPLELTITVPILPKVTLPNYKKVASEAINDDEKVEVTDKDIEDVLEELRKGRAVENDHVHHHEGHNHDGHDHDHFDESHDHKNKESKNTETKEGEIKKEVTLPPLDDSFAQSFGDSFKNLGDLKTKIGENLKLEKEQKLKEKRRTKIMEKLVEESKADLPDALIESELNNMLAQMRADITRFGGTWEDYLQHSKKTESQLKEDWKNDAAKRAMSQLVLHTIAETEKLHATEEEIEVELVRLLAQVQDADEERARAYLHQALSNEKALKFLEESK